MLASLGYCLVRADDQRRELAGKVRAFYDALPKEGEQISGGVLQWDCNSPEFYGKGWSSPQGPASLQQEWEKTVRAVLAEHGIGYGHLHFVAPKLLSASPGKGEQPPHWDNSECSGQYYTAVLYLADTHSTCMPRFHARLLHTREAPGHKDELCCPPLPAPSSVVGVPVLRARSGALHTPVRSSLNLSLTPRSRVACQLREGVRQSRGGRSGDGEAHRERVYEAEQRNVLEPRHVRAAPAPGAAALQFHA
jgi:hypothetical protein